MERLTVWIALLLKVPQHYIQHLPRRVRLSLVAVCIGVLGSIMLISSYAATASISSEPEQGTITGAASVITDAAASKGKAVKFGVGSSSGGTNPLASLPRMPWYGGPSYYNGFSVTAASGWGNASFFPIAAWYMRANQQSDIDTYKSLGINTDLVVENNDSLPLLKANGIWAVPQDQTGVGSESVGWTLTDEADMNYGPGNDQWNPNQSWPNNCTPTQDNGGQCGYTAMSTILGQYPANDGRFKYANFGKGIFPGWEDDATFGKFVNSYTTAISDDIYWYTDSDVCGSVQGPTLVTGTGPISPYSGLHDLTNAECRRASNYGAVIDRMRYLDGLDGKYQPIWSFVEVGTPFSNGITITGPQVEGAVMSSLIHGANGILYFKHNFGGTCQSNDSFIDCPSAPKTNVTKVDGYIKDLAPVLNTQSYQYSFGTSDDTMLKWYNGAAYVFAMGKNGSTGSHTFTLPAALSSPSSIQVLYENRNLTPVNGSFSDTFSAEYSYHIYKIAP